MINKKSFFWGIIFLLILIIFIIEFSSDLNYILAKNTIYENKNKKSNNKFIVDKIFVKGIIGQAWFRTNDDYLWKTLFMDKELNKFEEIMTGENSEVFLVSKTAFTKVFQNARFTITDVQEYFTTKNNKILYAVGLEQYLLEKGKIISQVNKINVSPSMQKVSSRIYNNENIYSIKTPYYICSVRDGRLSFEVANNNYIEIVVCVGSAEIQDIKNKKTYLIDKNIFFSDEKGIIKSVYDYRNLNNIIENEKLSFERINKIKEDLNKLKEIEYTFGTEQSKSEIDTQIIELDNKTLKSKSVEQVKQENKPVKVKKKII